jgi:hypothetical protein
MGKDRRCSLRYTGGEQWQVQCDGEVLRSYRTEDLRMSMVYRARCFGGQEERDRFHQHTERLPLSHILDAFSADLVSRGVLRPSASPSRLELALLILDTYNIYPLPPLDKALLPFNYCAIPTKYSWTSAIFKLIC